MADKSKRTNPSLSEMLQQEQRVRAARRALFEQMKRDALDG